MKFYVIQTIMGILGSVGFAVLFGILDRKLIGIALGGGAGWAVYLLCTANGQSMFVGLFVASLFIAAFSEVLARVLKAPVILLLVPMLIPEIPGEICITLCTIWCRDILRILEILPTRF